ncbi:putative diguanylate cyclase YcdT [Clostridium tepidiprofundi DSM 19306]|uniref:Putative diguanylate cyclase YcdT n=1 Tax=Clostridium tepidiprofundi DSM 19306 TaxID=1121338 RepID=A0A151B2C4_9CLOT|nr:sensor domain-containing diguanylate cyclase [Clostridium tepidiprofundi]KYH34069.1 putative diguanylate cyclase YcdT [Clostridium tepidiprofundi DSM 19306]
MAYNEKLLHEYKKIKEEFINYQNFTESTIQMLSDKNSKLEKKLNVMANIVEISKYINLNLSNDNLANVINDMIIGILGVAYSTIYISENSDWVVKATNISHEDFALHQEFHFNPLKKNNPFILNLGDTYDNNNLVALTGIHSVSGVPINIRDNELGFIVVEHNLMYFFDVEHIKFLSSIANQIGIALENNSLYKKVKDMSIKDSFLGIYNRKYFFDTVEKFISENPKQVFGIVMVDLDDFKKHNDKYGHLFGDYVLMNVTDIIKRNISSEDILARYGGEEIIIYLNDIKSSDEAFDKIEKIRREISETVFEYGNNASKITASFGIGFYPYNGLSLEEVINASDNMLYKAKEMGKNKVVCA